MGIFNFFNRTEKRAGSSLKKMGISESRNWVDLEMSKIKKEESSVLLELEQAISDFIKDSKEKILALENFDIESKREDERIKKIVISGRKMYIDFFKILIGNLKSLKKENLKDSLEDIHALVLGFNKKSFKNYEQANILIGSEIAELKEVLNVLSNKVLDISDKNKNTINRFYNLFNIKEKRNSIDSLDKSISGLEEHRSSLRKKLLNNESKIGEMEKNLGSIKKSKVYLDNLKISDKIKRLRSERKDNLSNLKQLIDFKMLANFFHSNSNKMDVIKGYKERFASEFDADNGEVLIGLLKEAGYNNKIIINKIENINSIPAEIKRKNKKIKDDGIAELSSKMKDFRFKIEENKKNIVDINRKIEKTKNDREDAFVSLEEDLMEVGVELEKINLKN